MAMAQQEHTGQGGKSRCSEWRGTHDPSFLRGLHSPENLYQFDSLLVAITQQGSILTLAKPSPIIYPKGEI